MADTPTSQQDQEKEDKQSNEHKHEHKSHRHHHHSRSRSRPAEEREKEENYDEKMVDSEVYSTSTSEPVTPASTPSSDADLADFGFGRKKRRSREKKVKLTKEEEEKKKADEPPPVFFFKLFRFASPLELCMVIVASLCSICHGAFNPLVSVFLGDAINKFGADTVCFCSQNFVILVACIRDGF